MSYETTSIRKTIEDIDANKIYLPALQRRFVWGRRQIEMLFDSIMRGYPIGAFLFWRLHKTKAESYVFYEFLKEYHQQNPYNRRKTGPFMPDEIIGVLDGQQRLSALYLGLMGTHAEKTPYKRASNPDAYHKTQLYINLFSLPYKLDQRNAIVQVEDVDFEFRFLVEKEALSFRMENNSRAPQFWLPVGKALSWHDDPDYEYLMDELAGGCINEQQRQHFAQNRRTIRKCMEVLHSRLEDRNLLSYFEVQKDDLEDILKIFVRVNSAGTPLSRTDLLFSTIVATWDDGREQIESCLKLINGKGDKFNFNNDFLMRCCLVLTDGPVAFKVQSFKSENVEKIRQEWENIKFAVIRMVDLLVEFGFNGTLLTSQNATIIVAYYLYRGGTISAESKNGIRMYLVHALLNGLYGSGQDAIITSLRKVFRHEADDDRAIPQYCKEPFPFDELVRMELPGRKRLAVSEDDLDRLMEIGKGPASFHILSLLYPHLRFQEVQFHQDHIHPAAGFGENNLKRVGVAPEDQKEWQRKCNCLPNLQLMEGRENSSKNKTPIEQWLQEMGPSASASFQSQNHFPEGIGLDFACFPEFFERRKELLRAKLRRVLVITSRPAPAEAEAATEGAEVGETELPHYPEVE